ncbi:MAG: leucine-rich repeat domain-containing protein, partial [Candidatus Methanomethylophilaceae archaeon]
MNKTLTAVAVVLLTVTALFAMADYEESDGDTTYIQGTTVRHLTTDFTVITDCGSVTYTNASVPSEYIFIAHCNVKANAFKDCTKIKEVIFDKSVGSVGDYAFAGCTNLNSMSGTYLTKIGAHAFEGTCIFYLSVGPNLTSIGDYAFKDCRSLQKIPTYNTSLTSIGNGVFYGCTGLRLMDMRGLTYTSPTAFQGTNIQRQILDVGQTYCLPDIPKIWIEDGSMYRNAPWGNATTYYVDSEVNSRITLFDMEGNEVENDISYESYATINRFTIEADKDYISGTYYRTVHFPEGLGLDDMPAKSGESFALPTVELGDITASKWVIAGITGEVDSINAWSMRTMGDDIYPLPVFNTTEAALIHTDVPSIVDVSGLLTTMTYTFGDAYPQLPEVDGYRHTGWRVGDEVLEPTAMISVFSAHDAYSLWTPTYMHTLTYTQKDGTTISTDQQGNGRDIVIADIAPEEEDGERFVGWRLDGVDSPVTAGYTVNMLDDITLSPVFDDRAVRQVSFISESVLIYTYEVYDGRTLTLDLDDPERDWFDFLYWKSGSTILTKGDSTTVTKDMEFNAYWKAVRKVSVTYHVDGETTVRDYRADTPVIVFLDPGEKEGMTFSGWSTSSTSDTATYRNGDSVDLKTNLDLYALWEEVPKTPPAEQIPEDPEEKPEEKPGENPDEK